MSWVSRNIYKELDETKLEKQDFISVISFTELIPFDKVLSTMEHTITTELNFTAATTNLLAGARTIVVLTADGTSAVNFGAQFTQAADSLAFNNVNGFKNTIEFLYDGSNYWYRILNDAGTNLVYKNQVLTLTNETAFTPLNDYHPATKKWTEEEIFAQIANYYPNSPSGSNIELGYYGVKWNESYPNTGMLRTGSLAGYTGGGYYNELAYGAATRPNSNVPEQYLFIHNRIKRCMLLDNGTVNYYLDANNSANKLGEAPSVTGTTTGTAVNKVIATGIFTGVVGDYVGKFVHNTTSGKTGRYAIVTAKDSDDQLSVDCGDNAGINDFFQTGDTFEICTAVFDGSDGQVMVEIPKFFQKYSYDSGTGIHQLEISLYPYTGFTVHPAFVEGAATKETIYVGAFEAWTNASSQLASLPYKDPSVSKTRATFRTQAAARTGWMQESFWYRSAIQTLFFVEYADFYSQYRLPGYTERIAYNDAYKRYVGRSLFTGNNNTIINADTTYDNDIESDGNWNDLEKVVANSYRGIENFYGHIWKAMDGINFNDRNVYVSNQRANFTDDTQAGYDDLGVAIPVGTGSYIREVHPVAGTFLPSLGGGASNTYLTDAFWSSTGWRVAFAGGLLSSGGIAGVGYLLANNDSGYARSFLGARLCF